MKKVILILFILPIFIQAQDKADEPKFGISFSGFVKTDAFFDSHQTINIREGHFLLYPDNILLDANNEDINAKPSFNILSIQSRLKGTIKGPEAFGAKTSGVIEADFFGNENTSFSDLNGFRLRHAFLKLNWKSTELLVGQYWHPMFVAEVFPGVVSFNTGAPFQPFSRNPQVRVSKKIGELKAIACLYSQRDFTSTGPEGSSSKYLRNSGIPNAHFQLQYMPDSTNHVFGLGVDYKILKPRLYGEVVVSPAQTIVDTNTWTTTNIAAVTKKYDVNESVASLSANAYLKFVFKPLTFKVEGVYAQNATDLVMIGGYAVKEISDPLTDTREYTNLNTLSVWTEVQTTGKTVQYGIFGGYTKNMGSSDSISGAIYARGSNIDYVYRVSPRVVFISGKVNIALEGEYTFAMYGTSNGNKMGNSTNNKSVANTRALLAFIYNF